MGGEERGAGVPAAVTELGGLANGLPAAELNSLSRLLIVVALTRAVLKCRRIMKYSMYVRTVRTHHAKHDSCNSPNDLQPCNFRQQILVTSDWRPLACTLLDYQLADVKCS